MSLDQVQPGLVSVVDRWVKVNMGGLDVRPTHVAASFLFFFSDEKSSAQYSLLGFIAYYELFIRKFY